MGGVQFTGGVSGKEDNQISQQDKKPKTNSNLANQARVVLTRSTPELRYFNTKGLPDEVLFLLFNGLAEKDLIQATLVCKTWRRVAQLITLHELTLDLNTFHKFVPLIQKQQISINRNFAVYYHERFHTKDSKNGLFILNAFKNNQLPITTFSIKNGTEHLLEDCKNTTCTNFIVAVSDRSRDGIPLTPNIKKFLSDHPLITSLTLPGDSPLGPILSHLENNQTIQKLSVVGQRFGAGPSLLNYLSVPNLSSLLLKQVDRSIPPLLGSLKVNTQLLELTFTNCSVDDTICGTLVAALSTNSTLQMLDLSQNCIDTGAIQIFKWLQFNNSLKVLSLSTNAIEDSTGRDCVPLVQENKALEKIYLWGNQIRFPTKQALQQASKAQFDWRWDRQMFLKTKLALRDRGTLQK